MKSLLAAALLAAFGTAHAQSATYTIEPTHTFAYFEIQHLGTSTIRVRFDRKEGMVQLDRAGKTGRVEVTVDTSSVNSGVAPFDGHLKSADLLNVAAHPSARLVADKFTFTGDKVTEIAGTLTFMGKTNPITLKALNFNCYVSPIFKREVCGGDFESTIVRSQYGVNYGLPAFAPDNVRLVIQVEAIRQ